MNLLAIDTSTENASLALLVDGTFYSEEHSGAQSHAQFILPAIDLLLKKANVKLDDLDGVVFGQGPGSFTGLRVACSIAKGLAYAANLPLYPVSTLAAIREAVFFDKSSVHGVLSVIDARMNQVYWSYASTLTNDFKNEMVSFACDVVVPETTSLCLAGVGWERYEHEFPSIISKIIVERAAIYPQAAAMIRMVLQGLVTAVNVCDAAPVYIRNQVTS